MLKTLFAGAAIALVCGAPQLGSAAEPKLESIDISSRRELFVDDFVIDKLQGARQRLHHPTPREVAIVHDQPWEGNTCFYHTVFRDGDLFRMYYRGSQHTPGNGSTHQVVCYAESEDGIRWAKPELGLVEFDGSEKNNIIWDGVGHHNFVPFKDPIPDCTPEARYKAIGGSKGEGGLFVDDYLADRSEKARRVLHHPTPREVLLVRNKPWEGNASGYTTVLQDGDLYRVYYRGTHVVYSQGKSERSHREVYCYAESKDGIQ